MNRRGLILGLMAAPLVVRSGILMPVSARFERRRFLLEYVADNPHWVVPTPQVASVIWDRRMREYDAASFAWARADGKEGPATWGRYDRCYCTQLS